MGVSPVPGSDHCRKYWGKQEAGSCQTTGPEVRLGPPASPFTRGIVWATPLAAGPSPASQQEASSKKMETSLQGHRVSLQCGDRCGVSVPLDPDRTWDNCGHRPHGSLISLRIHLSVLYYSRGCWVLSGQESKAVDRRNQRPRIPKMEDYYC